MDLIANLRKRINELPLLRPWGASRCLGEVCLIISRGNFRHLPQYLKAHPYLRPRRIIAPEHDPEKPFEVSLEVDGQSWTVAVAGPENIPSLVQYDKLFLFPQRPYFDAFCRALAPYGVRNIWLDGNWPPAFGWRKPQPDFFDKYAGELAQAAMLLATDMDREVFAARIKAILTGNAGWLPVSAHAEYKHPLVHARKGDVMIDGGLSDMVWAQEDFAEAVGTNGRILGFEPIPWMAQSAQAQLAKYPQYKVYSAGLGEKKGTLHFASLRDSSHVCDSASEGLDCEIVTIDDMVEAEGLERVDCIKLDVEGSELSALRGAKKTIEKFKPRLVVCLYHAPHDLFTIPLFVHRLVPKYRMHVAHSSCDFTDTILYATAQA